MKLEASVGGNPKVLRISCYQHEDDISHQERLRARVNLDSIEWQVPESFDIEHFHPDLEAMLGLLVYGPFSKSRIELARGVSREFYEIVSRHLKKELTPVDNSLSPRKQPLNGVDALAFSGGVDSVAAYAVMPPETVAIFMNRTIPPGFKAGLYRPDAALRTCAQVRSSGGNVCIVDTTMEFAREPVGFSVDWTNGAGAILLADIMNIRSVGYGMIAESAFYVGHPYFSHLAARSVYSNWAPIFSTVGVPINLPTCGVSEVVTAKIAKANSAKWIAQSCIRGTANEPCMKCFKCFRKTILDAKVQKIELHSEHFSTAYKSKEIKRRLLEIPIHHENVLAYSVNGIVCDDHAILRAIRQKVQAVYEYSEGVCFAESVYQGYTEYVPNFLRGYVDSELSKYARPMTEKQNAIFEGWNTQDLLDAETSISGHEQLAKLLER